MTSPFHLFKFVKWDRTKKRRKGHLLDIITVFIHWLFIRSLFIQLQQDFDKYEYFASIYSSGNQNDFIAGRENQFLFIHLLKVPFFRHGHEMAQISSFHSDYWNLYHNLSGDTLCTPGHTSGPASWKTPRCAPRSTLSPYEKQTHIWPHTWLKDLTDPLMDNHRGSFVWLPLCGQPFPDASCAVCYMGASLRMKVISVDRLHSHQIRLTEFCSVWSFVSLFVSLLV